jgi:hypothetical protein
MQFGSQLDYALPSPEINTGKAGAEGGGGPRLRVVCGVCLSHRLGWRQHGVHGETSGTSCPMPQHVARAAAWVRGCCLPRCRLPVVASSLLRVRRCLLGARCPAAGSARPQFG